MRIDQIKIQDFKNISNSTFCPGQITAFVGSNGAGKTSWMEAFRYLLTGEAPENPIQDGKTQAVVEGDIKPIGSLVRKITEKGTSVRLNGSSTTAKSVNELMEDAFKVKPMTAKVMTSSKLLMSMKAGELSEFLVNSGTIPVSIDLTKLKSLCAVSKEAETELEMVLPEAPAPIGLEDLNEAYAFFFTARTTLKQTLAAEKARAAYTGEMPAMNAAAIEKRLNEILAQEARVKAQQSQVDAYRAACVKRQKANEEMVKLAQKIKEITAKAPEPGAKEQLEKQMQEVQDRINSRSSTLLVLKKNVETLEKTLKALDTPYCPLSDKLVCKTDKSAVKEEIAETVRAAQEEIAAIERELSELKTRAALLEAKQKQLKEEETAYQQKVMLYQKYTFLKDHLPDVPEKPAEPESPAKYAKEKEELNRQKALIVKMEQAHESELKVKEVSNRLEVIEQLLDVLNPKKGIREKVVECALAPLVAFCNAKSEKLRSGFALNIAINNGVHLQYRTNPSMQFIDVASASAGEQLFVAFLILDMLNELTGYGVLMMDDLDKLDAEAFESMIKLLTSEEVLKSYDHILLGAVNHAQAVNTLKSHKEIAVIEL